MSWPTPYQKTFNMNFLKEVPLSEPEMTTDPEEGYQSCYKIQQCTQKEITLNNMAYTATVKNPVLKPDDTAYWKSDVFTTDSEGKKQQRPVWPTNKVFNCNPFNKAETKSNPDGVLHSRTSF